MAQRRFPVAIAWIAFLVSMLVGAGLTMHPNGILQGVGIALIVLPLVLFSILAAIYYRREKHETGADRPD